MKLDYKEVKNNTDCMCDELCCAICATCSILVFLCYSVIALNIKLNPPPFSLVAAAGINNFFCLSFQLCYNHEPTKHRAEMTSFILFLELLLLCQLPTSHYCYIWLL